MNENLPESWRRVLSLVQEWTGTLPSESGSSEEDLVAQEAHLGQPLPALIRAWYSLLGNNEQLYHHNSELHLTPLSELGISSFWEEMDGENIEGEESDYPRRLIIYSENQYLYNWVVLESDLHLPDPPVYIEDLDHIFGDASLLPSTTQFSEFAAQALAFEFATKNDGAFPLTSSSPLADAPTLFTAIATEPLIYPQEMRVWFREGILAVTMDNSWFCARASTEDARDSLLRQIPVKV